MILGVARGKFGNWLDLQYVNWQQGQGGRRNLDQFAEYLGFGRVTVSRWINGDRTPDDESALALSQVLGLDVFDALERPRPNSIQKLLMSLWGRLTPEDLAEIEEIVERAEQRATATTVTETVEKPRRRRSRPAA